MNNYQFFSASELSCKCNECDGDMNDQFMTKLIALRESCDFPFHITSAYRCDSHNVNIGGVKGSSHTKGRAVDIAVKGAKAFQLVSKASVFGMTGIGVKQSGHGRFIHLDNMDVEFNYNRPAIFSYK